MPDTAPEIKVSSRDEISLQYTSGTTSKPKGVLLTHANYIYGGEVMVKAMRVSPADRHLIVLPLFHAGRSSTPSSPCSWSAAASP